MRFLCAEVGGSGTAVESKSDSMLKAREQRTPAIFSLTRVFWKLRRPTSTVGKGVGKVPEGLLSDHFYGK
jgi:hypothetical protein